MRHRLLGVGIAVLVSACAFAQAAEKLTFEVASVKPAAPPQPGQPVFLRPPQGGPGTSDPGQITWSNATLKDVLMTAYDVKPYQVNSPGWLDMERYDIIAKVAEGTTKEQVNIMWQNLLRERFGVVVHHDSKEFQVDELQVARGGAKLKETTLDPNAPPPPPPTGPPGPPRLDRNGFPEMSAPGMTTFITAGPGAPSAHMAAKAQPLSQLATALEGQRIGVGHPVVDKTGLTGKYDFTLEFTLDLSRMPPPPPGAGPGPAPVAPAGDASEPGSNLAAAIQQQLGLRLVSGKAKLDVVVVDKAEKVPTAN